MIYNNIVEENTAVKTTLMPPSNNQSEGISSISANVNIPNDILWHIYWLIYGHFIQVHMTVK